MLILDSDIQCVHCLHSRSHTVRSLASEFVRTCELLAALSLSLLVARCSLALPSRRYLISVLDWRQPVQASHLAWCSNSIVYGSSKQFSLNMVSTGDTEESLTYMDWSKIEITVTTHRRYVKYMKILLRLGWTPLIKQIYKTKICPQDKWELFVYDVNQYCAWIYGSRVRLFHAVCIVVYRAYPNLLKFCGEFWLVIYDV